MTSTIDPQRRLSGTINADYDEFYSGTSPWRELGAKYKAKNLVEVCNRAGFKPQRILEVGAGEGAVLLHLDRMGFGAELHAVEIARSGIAAIEGRKLAAVKQVSWFNGYELPYEDDAFDAVILCHVLEHVEYERLLLREIRRVAPRQIIEVPLDYYDGIDAKYDHYLGYGHINVYTPSLVRFLLRSEGYRIDQELLTITHEEVMEYNEFVNMKRERNTASVAEFQKRMSDKTLKFYSSTKPQAEDMADALTVLCSRETQGRTVLKIGH